MLALQQFVTRIDAVDPTSREYVGLVRLFTAFVRGILGAGG